VPCIAEVCELTTPRSFDAHPQIQTHSHSPRGCERVYLSWPHAQAETLVAARQRHGSAFGTSTALEKRYLRLTAAPTADTVRPPHVLERALAVLKDKWQQVRMRGEGQQLSMAM
jgi:hypothetical protein